MFCERNILNIEIHLSKSSADSNPEVTVRFGDKFHAERIQSIKQKICLRNLKHNKDVKLIVERNEQELYSTGLSHHDNKIYVDKVVVDDFWEFNNNFYTPTSLLNDDYIEYIDKTEDGKWIKNTLVNNTHLFFNGSLVWDIKYPVRRSFFKDFHR